MTEPPGSPDFFSQTTQTTMPEAVQVLLKRRPGTTVAGFRAYYQNHHAKLVLPWCKANGVTYYAQVTSSYQAQFPVTCQHPILTIPAL